jgi:hypothetical protein
MWCRCDPYGKFLGAIYAIGWDIQLICEVNKLLSGDDFDYQCHSNLLRAVLPYGLTEADVHDVLNVFQVTGLNKDGKYFMLNPFIQKIRMKTNCAAGYAYFHTDLPPFYRRAQSSGASRELASPFVFVLGAGSSTPELPLKNQENSILIR